MYVQGKKTTNYETRNSVAKKTEQVADKRTLSNIKKKNYEVLKVRINTSVHVQTDRFWFSLVFLEQKPVQTGLTRFFWFNSVFRIDSVFFWF
jgi:hypothetical protein